MVQSGKNWRGDDRSAPLDSSLTAHPSPTPSACATSCNKTNMRTAFAADAARRRSEHDPGTHAEALVPASRDLPSGEMGRRLLVRWDLTVGPDSRDMVVARRGGLSAAARGVKSRSPSPFSDAS